ncbi:Dimethyladenosine transferase 2, mitochondrial [Eufriesea mexicana]|nr:Dimethyladenosine transferase 2, mitochondrial [Eufriesea mexicana]
MTYVIEVNPGYGLITQNLLKAGIPFIHLWESHNEFYPVLQNLKNIFPNQVKITQANLLKMSKMLNLNKAYESHTFNTYNRHISGLFNNISKRKWEEESCMQIIGISTNYRFIRHLIISTIFQTGFMMYGRTIFYLALSPSIWAVSTIIINFLHIY